MNELKYLKRHISGSGSDHEEQHGVIMLLLGNEHANVRVETGEHDASFACVLGDYLNRGKNRSDSSFLPLF